MNDAHASGTAGYVADIGYTSGFYPETAPGHLAFAALAAGRNPGRARRPGRVLELGFGQGFGLALLAAANPDIAFEGCDFNAAHVAHARGLGEAAGLANLTVTESSFEAAASRAGDADVDMVLLHGVLSWVARPVQDAIVTILRRRLRPDGCLYVSYNCLPGWAPLSPIRQFIADIKRRTGGGSERQLAVALDLLAALKQAGATYFVANPIAAAHVEAMLGMDRAYLAHEYLGDHWHLLQFADVAALLGEIGLGYAASATLTENFDAFAVPADCLPLLARAGDPVLRETLRDFAANKYFRRDVFVRGDAALDAMQRRDLLRTMRFALAVPRRRLGFKFRGPLNELIGHEDFYGPLADRLVQGIASFDDLVALPAFGDDAVGRLVECLALLVHSGQLLPVSASAEVATESARRFNRLIVDQARAGRLYGHLASPVAGSGVRVDDFGLLALAALFDGEAATPDAAARHGLSIVKALGRRPHDGDRPIEDDGEAIAFLAARMAPVIADDIPLWRGLGIL